MCKPARGKTAFSINSKSERGDTLASGAWSGACYDGFYQFHYQVCQREDIILVDFLTSQEVETGILRGKVGGKTTEYKGSVLLDEQAVDGSVESEMTQHFNDQRDGLRPQIVPRRQFVLNDCVALDRLHYYFRFSMKLNLMKSGLVGRPGVSTS